MSTYTNPTGQPDNTASTTHEDGSTTTAQPEVVTTQAGEAPETVTTATHTAPVVDPETGDTAAEPIASVTTETDGTGSTTYAADPFAPAIDDGQSRVQDLEDVPDHVTPGFYDEATNAYCVAPGDTLEGIAVQFYGNPAKSVDIATHNNLTAPVFLGQFLHLPDYTVPGKH